MYRQCTQPSENMRADRDSLTNLSCHFRLVAQSYLVRWLYIIHINNQSEL